MTIDPLIIAIVNSWKRTEMLMAAGKFLTKAWFAWLMVVLFLPLGLFLLWRYEHYAVKIRAGVTLCLMLMFMCMVSIVTVYVKSA